ncbi:MAG: hypothetical protein A2V67_11960 [Deltaproteobacteria bacterium RBG_13_61_14]|nr:MAG: hypothetical protein A2V67_11960 [Deltaproteobacteria bacterium RBG_13_61_14]
MEPGTSPKAENRGEVHSSNPRSEFKSLAWQEYLRTAEMSSSTRVTHQRHLAGLFALAASGLDPVSPIAVQTYLLTRPGAARSRAFSVFARFFRFALYSRWIEVDPMLSLRAPPRPAHSRQGLTDVELAAFLAEVERVSNSTDIRIRFASVRLAAMVRLSLDFGLRTGQHLDLHLADYDPRNLSIRVPPKTPRHDPVRVSLQPVQAASLDLWLSVRAGVPAFTERLWINWHGQPLTYEAIARQLEQVCSVSGCPRFSGLHLLRHTVARIMVEEGADLFQVQGYLGHKRVSYTDAYLRSNFPRQVFDASRLVGQKLARLHSTAGPGEASGAGTDKPPAPELPDPAVSLSNPPKRVSLPNPLKRVSLPNPLKRVSLPNPRKRRP